MQKQVCVRVKKNRAYKIVAIVLGIVVLLAVILEAGVFAEHFFYRPYLPDYEKRDIAAILDKEALSDEDYSLLYEQTGLSKSAIDDFLKSGEKQSILEIQQDFFGNYKVNSEQFAPFTCYHYVDKNIKLAKLKAGDIIVTPTTHFSIFRVGHSSIITDPEIGETVTATGYMDKSYTEDISALSDRPSFVILRARDSKVGEAAAKCAKEQLLDLQYSVSIGVIGKKFAEKIDRTHCGHLVWYAYKKQGVDIDANGGPFVFPWDMLKSSELEIVQVYGMDPKTLL